MPIVIGDRERMYRLGHQLRRRGLWVAPVDYSAVPQNRICFRACVTAKHTRADLDEVPNILEDTLVLAALQNDSGLDRDQLLMPSRITYPAAIPESTCKACDDEG